MHSEFTREDYEHAATPSPMVVAAARELCKRASEDCNLDFEDNWKIYGGDFLADAEAALKAAGAPELLEALQEIADDYADRFDMDSPSTNPGIKAVVAQARSVIGKSMKVAP